MKIHALMASMFPPISQAGDPRNPNCLVCAHPRSSMYKWKPFKPSLPLQNTARDLRICGRDGFTLLEILIALAMTGLILGTLLVVFTGMMSSSAYSSRKAELYQTGRAVMDLICADVRGFLPLSSLEGEVFFQGITAVSNDDQEATRLSLITTNTLTAGIGRNPFLSEIGYSVKKNPKDDLYSLWRRAEYPPSLPYEEGGSEVPICRILENFHLGFITSSGTNHHLIRGAPKAVILSFTLNLEGEREHFVTMVRPMVEPVGETGLPDPSVMKRTQTSVDG
ncbi:MAG: hypothetical protein CVU57_14450 [Deltaproteobacteria bacterium HGW-Deltaproteobacteria-15]|nr:MAG: hypothetical protein CVU57_14450 [Deltaproteobacteria bacterium HGW-Deltaproteobacteria-15]